MIKQVKLQNFQSHEDTTLNLSPGLNVIVGTSDSGKSAILRAIKWVQRNRPMGDAFRSWWGGDTRVEIVTDDDIAARFKSKEVPNGYSINGKILTAFGNDVPDEIQTALNMDETNLQQQIDLPFLISKSSGEVASYFNRVANLDQIDTSLKKIGGGIRNLTAQITSDEARSSSYTEELQQYNYLEELGVGLVELEQSQQLLNDKRSTVADLKDSINQLKECEELLAEVDQYQELLEPIDQILEQHTQRNSVVVDRSELLTLIQGYKGIDSQINRISQELLDMEEYYLAHVPDTCPLCGNEIKTEI